jgi:putative phage-type endonuclease
MGVSPWMTPLELWRVKLGMAPDVELNDAMRRGLEMEPVARAFYEAYTGNVVQPAFLVHPKHEWLHGSLDGLSFDGDLATEIKCPGRSVHEEAKEGHVPARYWPQIQHYLMISGASVLDYWSFDGVEGVLIPVEPDKNYQEELFERELAFWRRIIEREPPEPAAYQGRFDYHDGERLALAEDYVRLSAEAARVERELERVRRRLTSACEGAVNDVGPLTITRCRGRTTIDQAALECDGIDLDRYRKQGEDYWKIEMRRKT